MTRLEPMNLPRFPSFSLPNPWYHIETPLVVETINFAIDSLALQKRHLIVLNLSQVKNFLVNSNNLWFFVITS